MNSTLTAILCVTALTGTLWAGLRTIGGPGNRFPQRPVIGFAVVVVGWLGGAALSWATGHHPARPAVFAGYAVTTAALVLVGLPMVTGRVGRGADATRFVVFALIAFVCWRSQEVWLVGRT